MNLSITIASVKVETAIAIILGVSSRTFLQREENEDHQNSCSEHLSEENQILDKCNNALRQSLDALYIVRDQLDDLQKLQHHNPG